MVRDDQITTQEAAVILGVTDRRVNQLCIEHRLDGQRDGEGHWQINRASVEAHLAKLNRKPSRRAFTLPAGTVPETLPSNQQGLVAQLLIQQQTQITTILDELEKIAAMLRRRKAS